MTTGWAKFTFKGILTSNAICPHGFMIAHTSKTHIWNKQRKDSISFINGAKYGQWKSCMPFISNEKTKTSQKYLCKSLTMTLSSRSRIQRLFHPPTPDSDAFLQLPFYKTSFALMGAIQDLVKVNLVSLELSLRAECKPWL